MCITHICIGSVVCQTEQFITLVMPFLNSRCCLTEKKYERNHPHTISKNTIGTINFRKWFHLCRFQIFHRRWFTQDMWYWVIKNKTSMFSSKTLLSGVSKLVRCRCSCSCSWRNSRLSRGTLKMYLKVFCLYVNDWCFGTPLGSLLPWNSFSMTVKKPWIIN